MSLRFFLYFCKVLIKKDELEYISLSKNDIMIEHSISILFIFISV